MAKRKTGKKAAGVSRRDFLASSALGAGFVSMDAIDDGAGAAAEKPIAVPTELTESLAENAVPSAFGESGLNGAKVFTYACRNEGLAALFCCPGNYGIINAMATEGIPTYGGRTEGSMCAAADAFVRVTGEVAACSGTEGPGFTNMIMNIAAANAARTPLLVLASNKSISQDDMEAGIQVAYQQPTTVGLRKYGKRLITPNRTYEYAAYAFRQLKTGVGGPVHLDFPAEITRGSFKEADLRGFHDKSRYRTESKPHASPKDIAAAVDLLGKATRPMIVASMGVFYDKAWEELRALAEKADIAVVESGPMRGHFPDDHRLSTSRAPDTLGSADLVMFVGQYCMPPFGEFAFSAEAKYIRIDPKPEDIGRNWPIDLGIISGEKGALAALAEAVPPTRRGTWVAEIAAAQRAFEEENAALYQRGLNASTDDIIHPAVVGKGLEDFLHQGDLPPEQTTVVQGGYIFARYTRRFVRALRPGQICNGAYQYGAIGPDVGYTVGVGAAVQLGAGVQQAYRGHPVICLTGDAGFGYSGMEMETLAKYRIPSVVIVYNNNAWGVHGSGRTSTRAGRERTRSYHMYLFQENVRYDKVAEGLGARGEYVTRAADFLPALQRSYQIAADQGVSTVINCQASKDINILGKREPGCMAYNH